MDLVVGGVVSVLDSNVKIVFGSYFPFSLPHVVDMLVAGWSERTAFL